MTVDTSNVNLIIAQSLFVIYIIWQHAEFSLFKENSDDNPHFQMIFLFLLSALFLIQAWWLFVFLLLFAHSKIISVPLSKLVVLTYELLEKKNS